jgi:hypothetical protein
VSAADDIEVILLYLVEFVNQSLKIASKSRGIAPSSAGDTPFSKLADQLVRQM